MIQGRRTKRIHAFQVHVFSVIYDDEVKFDSLFFVKKILSSKALLLLLHCYRAIMEWFRNFYQIQKLVVRSLLLVIERVTTMHSRLERGCYNCKNRRNNDYKKLDGTLIVLNFLVLLLKKVVKGQEDVCFSLIGPFSILFVRKEFAGV